MGQARLIRVFVSSPDDVAKERDAVAGVLERINNTVGEAKGFVLRPWRYEKNATPQSGPSAQKVVDDQTPDYDIYLGIMSARFGTPTDGFGSGTEKEFRDAVQRWQAERRPHVLFYFHQTPPPPQHAKDAEQLLLVMRFREELQATGLLGSYCGLEEGDQAFTKKIHDDLIRLALRTVSPPDNEPPSAGDDPQRYLSWLLNRTAYIDIRGLGRVTGDAKRFSIEDLYMTLRTHRRADASAKRKAKSTANKKSPVASADSPEAVDLQRTLGERRLVVIGDPGAGKTTFLRRVACSWCRVQLHDDKDSAAWLGHRRRTSRRKTTRKRPANTSGPCIPILVSLAELHRHIEDSSGQAGRPKSRSAAAWLPDYLATQADDHVWHLDKAFFTARLEAGECVILLDGLDEAPDRSARKRLAEWIDNLTAAYGACPMVVSSRPAAYEGDAVLPGFAQARIEPLDEAAIELFLRRWCQALYADDPASAAEHLRQLVHAMRDRPEIYRMARNPVMLTSLAVVHWNRKRLPEQRADLYEAILVQLAESREERPGREDPDRVLGVLQELALKMQDHPEGRQVQVPRRWAAEAIRKPEESAARQRRVTNRRVRQTSEACAREGEAQPYLRVQRFPRRFTPATRTPTEPAGGRWRPTLNRTIGPRQSPPACG